MWKHIYTGQTDSLQDGAHMRGRQDTSRKGSWETSQEPSFFSPYPFIIFDPTGKSHSLSVKPGKACVSLKQPGLERSHYD